MKAVVQRVTGALVRVDGDIVGAIQGGLLLFVGVEEGDTESDALALVEKVASLRIFSDDQGKMNLSVVDVAGSVLVVSQFTLSAVIAKGRRPSFSNAAEPDAARGLIGRVVSLLAEAGLEVSEGSFGAHMEVELTNDGPVTILMDVKDGRVL